MWNSLARKTREKKLALKWNRSPELKVKEDIF